MKETTQPPKDPKKKLWIGYAVILAIVILSNVFLFPALMQASVKSVNYSTFLQMLEDKELSTVQIEDQQIYFVDKNENSYKTNAIAQARSKKTFPFSGGPPPVLFILLFPSGSVNRKKAPGT